MTKEKELTRKGFRYFVLQLPNGLYHTSTTKPNNQISRAAIYQSAYKQGSNGFIEWLANELKASIVEVTGCAGMYGRMQY